MARVYVIAQTLNVTSEAFRFTATGAIARQLEDLDGVLCVEENRQLTLHGVSEPALAAAASVLRAHHGKDIWLGPRRICYHENPPMEPIMDVFVTVPASLGDGVLANLRKRRGRVVLTTVDKSSWLIRAQASMADLLGFPADLRSAAEDRADHWITFNHWRPIEPSPDTAA